jgi:PAS domain S-box-containing protein
VKRVETLRAGRYGGRTQHATRLHGPRYALLLGVLFGVYVAAARLGIELSVAHGVITPVWAPTGIALAALVLYGRRLWPAVALGALVANALSGASIQEAAAIAVGNTLEAIVGRELLVRANFRPALDRVRDVLALIVFGAVASTAISATNGVTTLWISGDVAGSSYDSEWLLWWIGDAMGDLLVAPLIFVLSTGSWRRLGRRARLEALALTAALVGVSAFVFLAGYWRYPHLLFPLLIWAVLRFGQLGAVTSSFVVSSIAIAGAIEGAIPLADRGATEAVQILEGLMAAVVVSLLILGAVLAERARAEASLAEAQELAHIGSWEWDIATNRVFWSDELFRLWGRNPKAADVTYESYLASVHPADRELVEETVTRALADAEPFAFEHRIPLPDRRVRWIASRGRVITDESGAPVRMVGTAQDITERKRIDALRDSILSTVSHELRTPLTSIVGFAMTLKARGVKLAEPTAQEIVENLNEQAHKLDGLLSDLLDLDRLRHGFVLPSFRPTDVGELVSQVAAGHDSQSHRVHVVAETATAEVDAPKVERIVENLLANAFTHTPPGTEVRVRVRQHDGGVLIAVDDRGPGIAGEQREAIFEIFNRGTALADVRGTGIGLSLVSQFTALHGGRAWVEENPGGGSSFRVFLPGTRAE